MNMKKLFLSVLAASLLASSGTAGAADKPSKLRDLSVDRTEAESQDPNSGKPNVIIVNQQGAPAAGNLTITLLSGRGTESSYAAGDEMNIRFTVGQDCYVTLLELGTSGQASVIFPNEYSVNNYIKKGQIYTVPEKGSKYKITAELPAGDQYVLAMASPQKINAKAYLNELTPPAGKRDLKIDASDSQGGQGETPFNPDVFQNFFKAVAKGENLQHGKDLASAACRFRIKGSADEKVLKITSSPSGAQVLIDGTTAGKTPLEITSSANKGEHEITLVLKGYKTSVKKFVFPLNRTKTHDVELEMIKNKWND